MKFVSILALLAIVATSSTATAQQAGAAEVEGVVRAGSAKATPGPATAFSGPVSVAQLVVPRPPSRTALGFVTFQPGARSNWHTHPAGQSFYVTEGCGWTQREGSSVERVCAGDTVTVPAGIKHWHGATATTAMSHLAMTETVDAKNVDWLEPVTDAQYVGPNGQ